MSIIALKRNAEAKYLKNNSNNKEGFSIWPSINSGIYNGSRIIPGMSSVQTPYKGNFPVNNNNNKNNLIVRNCPYPSNVCKKNNIVLNNKAYLNNKLVGINYGNKNVVKQYVNNNIYHEVADKNANKALSCYSNSVANPDTLDYNISCQSNIIKVGNNRKIIVGNFVKGKDLMNLPLTQSEYMKSSLMKNKCLKYKIAS